MNGNDSYKSRSERAQRLANGSIRLINAQYFALLVSVDMLGDDGVQHRVAQPVKQAVNAHANCVGEEY